MVLALAALSIGKAATPPAPPSNDALDAAIEVTGATFMLATDLGGATRETFEVITPVEHGHSAWWAWTVPENGTYGWDAFGSSNRVAVGIFQRDAFGQLQLLASTEVAYTRTPNGTFLAPEAQGVFRAEAGVRYLIRLDLTAIYQPPPFLSLPPPAVPRPVSVFFQRVATPAPVNDLFAGRLTIPDAGGSFTAPLSLATVEPAEPFPGAEPFRHTLWWTWKAPGHGTATIKVANPASGAVASVYTRGLWESLDLTATSATLIGNQCYSFSWGHELVTWHTSPGAVFEIQVGRFSTFVSPLPAGLELVFTPAPANDVPEGAISLTGADLSLTATNHGATLRNEIVLPGGTGSNSVWFRWSAPARGVLQVSRADPVHYEDPDFKPTDVTGVINTTIDFCTSEYDLHPLPVFVPLFGVFSGEPANGTKPARPSSLLASGTNGTMVEIGAQGDYWIQLDGVQDTAGETPLNLLFIPAPVNQGVSNRISLPSESLRVTGRTFGASTNAGVWWEWHAPAVGRWTLFVSQGELENSFVLYRGNAALPENEVKRTQRDPIVFTTTAGEVFQIGVFAATRFGSSLRFTLTPAQAPSLRLNGLSEYIGLNYRSVRMQVADNPGLPYLVEQSGDLNHWTAIFTNLNAFAHTIELRDQIGAANSFFRARLAENPSP